MCPSSFGEELQADVFVTSNGELAHAVSGLLEAARMNALRTP
jgi:hypothetical protein